MTDDVMCGVRNPDDLNDACDFPPGHDRIEDDEGNLWDHAYHFRRPVAGYWNIITTPPVADRFHAVYADGVGKPGETFQTMCGKTFTHGTVEPDVACVDCLKILSDACLDYAERMTNVSQGLIAAFASLNVVDDALARSGPARVVGLREDHDPTPGDDPVHEYTRKVLLEGTADVEPMESVCAREHTTGQVCILPDNHWET